MLITKRIGISFSTPGSGQHEIEAIATISAEAGAPERFDSNAGFRLPGDPPEIRLLELKLAQPRATVLGVPDWLFDLFANDDGWLGAMVAAENEEAQA